MSAGKFEERVTVTLLALLALGGAGFVAQACASAKEHPGSAERICGDAGCGSGSGSGAGAGAGGSGNSEAGADSGALTTVTVSVDAFGDPTLSDQGIVPVTGDVDLQLEAPLGAVIGTYRGAPVAMVDVLASPVAFGVATPLSAAFVRTSQFVDTRGATATLHVVSATAIDGIFAATVPARTYRPSATQIVVQFYDANGLPRSGVSVASHGGETVLYLAGAAWSNSATDTDQNGGALIINSSSGQQTLTYDTGAGPQSVSIDPGGSGVFFIGLGT